MVYLEGGMIFGNGTSRIATLLYRLNSIACTKTVSD